MKKFIFLLAFAFVALAASAQIGAVKTTTVKTLVGSATVTSDVIPVTGQYNAISIQTVYATVTGTTAGTATLKGSVDGTSYVTITDAAGLAKGYPNDTATVANALIWDFVVQDAPFNYYKVVTVGSGTHTTTVTTKYVLK